MKRDIHFKKVAIIGVGLIGSSLAMVLRQKGISSQIIGIGRGIKNLETAKKLGVVDSYTQDVKEGVKDCDLVVVATPVASIVKIVKDILFGLILCLDLFLNLFFRKIGDWSFIGHYGGCI